MGDLTIELLVNQRIEILDNNLTYRCNVQDIQNGYVIINMPISGSKYYVMHPGTSLEFYAFSNKEVYKCRSVVLGKKEENNIHLIILSSPEVIEKVQRREYFRLPISMEANYCLLSETSQYSNLKDIPSGYFNKMNKCITADISGGGIRIITREPVLVDRNILVSIKIPDDINLLCSVVRVEHDKIEKLYRVSLRFVNIDERVRDKIIKYIFDKLREQSKLLK